MTVKTYSTLANARRALKNISIEALKHASELITEEETGYAFNLEAAEACEAKQLEVWEEPVAEEKVDVFAVFAQPKTINPPVQQAQAKPVAPVVSTPTVAPVAPVAVTTAKTLLPNAEEILDADGCPYCGDIYNGVTFDDEPGKETEYVFCHICSTSFSSEDGHLRPSKKTVSTSGRASSETQAVTMKTSLKLDRTIVCLTNAKVYKNAFQMWKANMDWMTSSQQDTLTAKLYAAAKKGEKLLVNVNGRDFQLKNV